MKLVNKIASLMTEAGNKWFHRSAGRPISVKAAKNIQKRAYENSFCSPDESCTPVYREIALQLEDKNEQVFRAAVYNLYKIAAVSRRCRPEILEILVKKAENLQFGAEMHSYMYDKISRLKEM